MEKVSSLLQQNYNELTSYQENTKKNVERIEKEQAEAEEKLKEIEDTRRTIKMLCKNAQATGYVKLSPLCHIFATIKHTGEYNVHYDNNYNVILTTEQTLEYLDRKKKDVKFDLEIYENQINQLAKRLNIEGEIPNFSDIPPPDTENMPEKIETDFGVAVKNAGFYEIIEIDESIPYVSQKDKKRISRLKNK